MSDAEHIAVQAGVMQERLDAYPLLDQYGQRLRAHPGCAAIPTACVFL